MGPGDLRESHDDSSQAQHPAPETRRPAVIGLFVVLALVVASYFLVTALRQNANLEDCLMSGRKNCAPIEVPASRR